METEESNFSSKWIRHHKDKREVGAVKSMLLWRSASYTEGFVLSMSK